MRVYFERGVLMDTHSRTPVPDVDSFCFLGGPGRAKTVEIWYDNGRKEMADYEEPLYSGPVMNGNVHDKTAHEMLKLGTAVGAQVEVHGQLKQGDMLFSFRLTEEEDLNTGDYFVRVQSDTFKVVNDEIVASQPAGIGGGQTVSATALAHARDPQEMKDRAKQDLALSWGKVFFAHIEDLLKNGTFAMGTAQNSAPKGGQVNVQIMPPTSSSFDKRLEELRKKTLESFNMSRKPAVTDNKNSYPIADDDTCPDCKGTGEYHGLAVSEPCSRCSGTGKV